MLFKKQMMTDLMLFSEPSQLLPCVSVGGVRDRLLECGSIASSSQELRDRRVADGGTTGKGLRPRFAQPLAHLLDPPRREHRMNAPGDPASQAFRRSLDPERPESLQQGSGGPLLPIQDRDSGGFLDLDCPNKAPGVAPIDAGEGSRVDRRKPPGKLGEGEGLQLLPQRRIGRRSLAKAPDHTAIIKAGPTHHDHRTFLIPTGFQESMGIFPILRHRKGIAPIHQVDSSVGKANPLLGGRFGRSSIEAAIDLHRIHRQKASPASLRERVRQRGFPYSRRADDKKRLARLDPVKPSAYLLSMHLLALALLGLLAGFASGCFGIGGGTILVPVLILSFAIPYHIAVGTSLALILPIALAGSLTNWTLKQIDWNVFTVIAISGAAGAALGALFIQMIPAVYAKRAFAVFLLYAAYRLWR